MTVPGVFSREECEDLLRRALAATTTARAEASLLCLSYASVDFARGNAHVARLTGTFELALTVAVGQRTASSFTNQTDDAALRALAARTELAALANRSPSGIAPRPPRAFPAGPPLAYDSTIAAMGSDAQASVADRALQAAEAANLIAAGTVSVMVHTRAMRSTDGFLGYERMTSGAFSMTARNDAKHASGWGWSAYEDWSRVNTQRVIDHAVDLGVRSANPVAIEPGRYTVILEPTAVNELIEPIASAPTAFWGGNYANSGRGPFAKDPLGTNKIGLQMIDRRLGMVGNPHDPERPASMITFFWDPIPGPVTWFEDGVLQNLADLSRNGGPPVVDPRGVRLAAKGPSTSLEDMIAHTRRGIWVNRFSDVLVMDSRTMLLTGTTRDGAFLIENGKITKPVKNLRFTESPFFVLNRLEAWGEPVRAGSMVVAPRLMLRDFNFTSTTDAI